MRSERLVRHARRHETTLLLVAAAIFTAAAIQVFSAFVEPSQPPAVAAVELGDPRDIADSKRDPVKRASRLSPRRSSTESLKRAPAVPAAVVSPPVSRGHDRDASPAD